MLDIQNFLHVHDPVIEVTIAEIKGSSPREEGAHILVSATAFYGTIGGGQLEYLAIDEARRLIRSGTDEKALTVPLGPEIGQCCGGVVTLQFAKLDEQAKQSAITKERADRASFSSVYIFGAGHVGRALAACMSLLPLRPILVDSRPEELALCTSPVEQRCTPLPEAEIRSASAGAAFLILTHDHALDFLLAREALGRNDAAYVGMIGSKSKRGTFTNWLDREAPELGVVARDALVCPIGAGRATDKRPQVIAAMVAAEVMTALEQATQPFSAEKVKV